MRIKMKYILMILTAMIFTACVNDNGSCLDEGVRRLSFRIDMDEATSRSRASWGSPYESEEGVDFDKLIKHDALRIVIADVDNTMLGEVDNILHWKESDGSYRVLGEITNIKLTAGVTYKILVLANCGTAAVQESMTFSISDLSNAIPMWGVLNAELTLESNQDLGTIDLLRSAAKVEVVLSPELIAQGYALNSAGLRNYRNAGYVYPYGWNTANATKDIDQENCLIETGELVSSLKAMSVNDTRSAAVLYMPEYGNAVYGATNPTSISIEVNKTSGTGDGATTETRFFEDAIKFCSYDASGLAIFDSNYNIVRNHIYRYVIAGVSDGGLEVVYMVADWEDAEEYPYILDYPTYHNPVAPDDYNRVQHDANFDNYPDPTMKYNPLESEKDAFSCWFKMSAPLGQKWTPVIRESEADYIIKVYKESNIDRTLTEVSNDALVADADCWYNIKVIPQKDLEQGTTRRVKFGITYDMSWHTGSTQFLFINGAANNITWPNSGDDPKIIEIQHVASGGSS